MSVANYIEHLMESVGKQVAEFKYTVGGVENTYITVDVAGEVRLNVVGATDAVFRWRGNGDVATAQAELEKLVAKVGPALFRRLNIEKQEAILWRRIPTRMPGLSNGTTTTA